MTNLKLLARKFPEEDIEWRIQQCGKGGNSNYWAMIIPYITNRAIMQRLDDVVGPGNWKNEYKATPCNTGYQCGISIKIDNEWVTRWDGSVMVGAGNIDKVKSTMSAAMKRAGVQWGIGRYLYQFEAAFAITDHCDKRSAVGVGFTYHENKKKGERFQWKPPALEAWALPITKKDIQKTIALFETVQNVQELRYAWEMAYKAAVSEGDDELLAKFTEAKDNAKERLDHQASEQGNQSKQALLNEIAKQKGIIQAGVNESSITGLTNIAIAQVKSMSKGEDLTMAMKEINQFSKTTLMNLQG